MPRRRMTTTHGADLRTLPPEGKVIIALIFKTSGKARYEVDGVVSEQLASQIYNMVSNNKPHPDTIRMDKLEKKVVNVRHPLRYGSKEGFWASPTDEDGGPAGPSDIRHKIDQME